MSPQNFQKHMSGMCVRVSNLPPQHVSEEELYNIFSRYGSIISIQFDRTKRSRYSSIAYVSFKSSRYAFSACAELDDVDIFSDGHPLSLRQGVLMHWFSKHSRVDWVHVQFEGKVISREAFQLISSFVIWCVNIPHDSGFLIYWKTWCTYTSKEKRKIYFTSRGTSKCFFCFGAFMCPRIIKMSTSKEGEYDSSS